MSVFDALGEFDELVGKFIEPSADDIELIKEMQYSEIKPLITVLKMIDGYIFPDIFDKYIEIDGFMDKLKKNDLKLYDKILSDEAKTVNGYLRLFKMSYLKDRYMFKEIKKIYSGNILSKKAYSQEVIQKIIEYINDTQFNVNGQDVCDFQIEFDYKLRRHVMKTVYMKFRNILNADQKKKIVSPADFPYPHCTSKMGDPCSHYDYHHVRSFYDFYNVIKADQVRVSSYSSPNLFICFTLLGIKMFDQNSPFCFDVNGVYPCCLLNSISLVYPVSINWMRTNVACYPRFCNKCRNQGINDAIENDFFIPAKHYVLIVLVKIERLSSRSAKTSLIRKISSLPVNLIARICNAVIYSGSDKIPQSHVDAVIKNMF